MITEPLPRPTLTSRWRSWTEPLQSGLPNRRVVCAPLVALGLLFAVMVGLGVTGSSTGFLHQFVSQGSDPNLILGQPQQIRSDEWYVQTAWTISQVRQGLPIDNQSFPGGMDATVQHDLPSGDWSVAFRPHLLGFFFLPLDNAMAFKWWLPPLAMIAAIYLFVVTLLPRRPVTAALLAAGFFYAPYLQWWFLSITFWPLAWAFLLMTAVVWLLRSENRAPKVVFPLLVGYLAVTTAMGIYVPFIIAVTLVALAFAIGFTVTRSSSPVSGVWTRLLRLKWIFAAGIGAGFVLLLWLVSRWETIQGFTSTVYPGERLQTVGEAGLARLEAFMSGIFMFGVGESEGAPYGPNASEASTFILPGLFLAIPLLWLIVSNIRKRLPVDWLSIALLGLGALIIAYLFVPGWDVIAHLLLLDRAPYDRLRMTVGLMSLVLIVVTIMRIDEKPLSEAQRFPYWVRSVAVGSTLALNAALAILLVRGNSPIAAEWMVWVPLVVLFALSVWFFTSRRPVWGAAAFAIIGVVCGIGVNPVYMGVFDLNGTSLVSTMKSLTEESPGEWVGVGDGFLTTAVLVQSGLGSYNGFQSAPPTEMWEQIDPSGTNEKAWNRLANLTWGAGDGPPRPWNPAPDQIRMTFDSCETFAQENVRHVLSETELDQDCLTPVKTVNQGPSTFWIYEVAPKV